MLKGHKYGISQIKVYRELVISIGDDNDKGVIVWETFSPRMLSANFTKRAVVRGAVIVSDSRSLISFATYGSRGHFKLWNVKVEDDQYKTYYSIPEGHLKQEPGSTVPKMKPIKLRLADKDSTIT